MSNYRVKIEVTQDDIDKGERMSCQTCPVARALIRQIPAIAAVEPMVGCLWIAYPPHGSVPTPVRVVQFIRRFDRGRPVKPFKFFLEPKPCHDSTD